MDYQSLCTALADTVENEFTADQLALFFKQAEQKIYSAVQLPNLRKSATLTLTMGNRYLDAPADFISVYSFAVILGTGAYSYLLDKDVNFIREAYPNPTTTGTPKHYAIFGAQAGDANELRFLLGPTPSSALSAELNYFYYPESIVTAGDTWLSENFDSVLLNGALVEAIRFTKGEQDMVALYEKMFGQSMALLKTMGDGKQRQDAYRSGQARVKVE